MTEPFYEVDGRTVRITSPRMRGRGAVIPPEEHFDWYVLSAMFNTFGIVRDQDTWDRFDPPGTDTGRTPLSATAFEQIVSDRQQYIRNFVRSLNSLGLPLAIVEPPYPFRHIRAVQKVGPDRALGIDHLVRQSAHAFLAEQRVPVVEVPARLRTDDGFTQRGLIHSRWPHHGNADFGEAMIGEMVRTLDGLGKQAPLREADRQAGGDGEGDGGSEQYHA